MATKKAATTKKKVVAKKKPQASLVSQALSSFDKAFGVTDTKLPKNIFSILLAEIIGTFALTLVALAAIAQGFSPLYTGLTYGVLVLVIGAVSGAHVNPAVTFGYWAARKINLVQVPFYWAAQFVGAIIAALTLGLVSDGVYSLDLGHFSNLDGGILAIEAIGTALLVFGVIAVASQKTISDTAKALGVGLSAVVGLVVAGSLLTNLQSGVDVSNARADQPDTIPYAYRVEAATLNPAIALAATEKSDSDFVGGAPEKDAQNFSRLNLEVILGTLLGAVVGGNLYLAIADSKKRK